MDESSNQMLGSPLFVGQRLKPRPPPHPSAPGTFLPGGVIEAAVTADAFTSPPPRIRARIRARPREHLQALIPAARPEASAGIRLQPQDATREEASQ